MINIKRPELALALHPNKRLARIRARSEARFFLRPELKAGFENVQNPPFSISFVSGPASLEGQMSSGAGDEKYDS
jgi:hypothetical protein